MAVQVVKLLPLEHFRIRIGEGRMDRIGNLVHSDTLFSALVNSGIKLYGEDLFAPMIDSLCLSSVFYGCEWKRETKVETFCSSPNPEPVFVNLKTPLRGKSSSDYPGYLLPLYPKFVKTMIMRKPFFRLTSLTLTNLCFLILSFVYLPLRESPGLKKTSVFSGRR